MLGLGGVGRPNIPLTRFEMGTGELFTITIKQGNSSRRGGEDEECFGLGGVVVNAADYLNR